MGAVEMGALISAIAGLVVAVPGLVRDVQAIVEGGGTPEEIVAKLAALTTQLASDKARVAAVYPPALVPDYVPDPKPTVR